MCTQAESIVAEVIAHVLDSVVISDVNDAGGDDSGGTSLGLEPAAATRGRGREDDSSGGLDSADPPAGLHRRVSTRKKKLNYLCREHQELRRLVRQGEAQPLLDFLKQTEEEEHIPEVAQLLNIRDEEGGTVLNEISSKNSQFVKIAEILIQHEADVNQGDGLGNTPLHNALLYYPATDQMVHLLLEHGASMQSRNLSGWTPIQMSDDVGLKNYIGKSQDKDSLSLLQSWLSAISKTSKDAITKRTYDPLPESPYRGILKRRLKRTDAAGDVVKNKPKVENPQLPEDSAGHRVNRGVKRRRESEQEEGTRNKRIRFAPNDSCGSSIDPEFSDDDISD